MSTTERFWTRRLRWRLLGAWRWPAFVLFTALDGVILDRWSPAGFDFNLPIGLIGASFGNLALLAGVELLARRADRHRAGGAQRTPTEDAELVVDRMAVAALVVGSVAVLAAGLASQPTVITPSEAAEKNARLVGDFVRARGSAEVRRNLGTANTIELQDNYFRTCVSLDDRTKAYCLFVDTNDESVVVDPNPAPNGKLFGRPRAR